MKRPIQLCVVAAMALLGLDLTIARAHSPHAEIATEIGLPSAPDSDTELRIWIESNARVNELYRVAKVDQTVRVDRYAFSEVVHPTEKGYSASEARGETQTNRNLLREEQCSGEITQTSDHLWCRIALQHQGPWQWLFDDLLTDELWDLPPQARVTCGDFVILDGERITIEVIKRGHRHTASYSNPDICCPTIACAIVDHVRSVIHHVY